MNFQESTIIFNIVGQALNSSSYEVLREFTSINDNSDKIKFVSKLLQQRGLLDHSTQQLKIPKDDKKSDECRNDGNKLYAKSHYVSAVEKYNESLCFAESSKNLAVAYANRSAVCFELNMYSTCLQNINLAKAHDYPADKLHKLDERAEKCHRMIIEGAETDADMLNPSGEEFLKLSRPPHPKLPYIADCLDIKFNDEFGRHIITNKRLLPGEIVCIESPFSKCLLESHKYKHCTNCMENSFLSLTPCQLSTSAMFCSAKCKIEAFKSYYEYKVDIIDELRRICPGYIIMAIETFLKSLKICDGDLQKLKSLVEINESNPKLSIIDVENPNDPIDVLKVIQGLQTHEDKYSAVQMFIRCGSIAIITELFKKHTEFADIVKTEDDWNFFRSFLLKTFLIVMINGHYFNGLTAMNKSEMYASHPNKGAGIGVFPFLSQLSHSCSPNVTRNGDNESNILIVLRTIEPGTKLLDNYCGSFEFCDFRLRQQMLKEQFFVCKCEACMNVDKFPLLHALPYKINDSLFQQECMQITLSMMKIDATQSKRAFKMIRKILIQKKKFYPCMELLTLQSNLLKCYMIFLSSKLLLRLINE